MNIQSKCYCSVCTLICWNIPEFHYWLYAHVFLNLQIFLHEYTGQAWLQCLYIDTFKHPYFLILIIRRCIATSMNIYLWIYTGQALLQCLYSDTFIHPYGAATASRIDKITGLFCKGDLKKRQYSAKETYNFIDPTDRSHPIPIFSHL